MKKFLLKIITVVLSLIVVTGSVASCGLFETDVDEDMKQVVATVDIGDGIEAEDIYKRELISGFMSYGYMYVQSYGYTTSATYELILDNLINNKIILQNAKVALAKADTRANTNDVIDAIKNGGKGYELALLASPADVKAFEGKNANLCTEEKKYSEDYFEGLANYVATTYKDKKVGADDAIFRFVDADDIWQIISDTKDSVNSLLDSFKDAEEEHDHENVSYTIRTTPTMDEDEDEDLTDEEVAKFKANVIRIESNKDLNALTDAYDRFLEIGLIDSHESYDANIKDKQARDVSILNLTYFKNAIVGSLEAKIIEKYEDVLREENQLKADVTADQDSLWESYVALQNAQKEQFAGDVSSLETALGAISDSSFVAYNELSGYAYVSHLLIQYGADVKADLEEAIKGNVTNAKVKEEVNKAVKNIKAQDLRSSWVQAGYGVYENGGVRFTSDYVYDTDGVLAKFDGTIERIAAHAEENDAGQEVLHLNYYGVKGNEIDYDAFRALASKVITGSDSASPLELDVVNTVSDYATVKEDVKNRFEDLKFAYSTDEGNFNNYLGYLYSPVTSDTQYVKAFAEACSKAITQGAGSYVMFGSYEYGLHIVLCTEIAADYLLYTDKAAFVAALTEEGTVAYNFLEATNDLLETNYISKLANKFVQDGLDKEGCVVKNEKALKDLITEEE